jgi:hypothetical protein
MFHVACGCINRTRCPKSAKYETMDPSKQALSQTASPSCIPQTPLKAVQTHPVRWQSFVATCLGKAWERQCG